MTFVRLAIPRHLLVLLLEFDESWCIAVLLRKRSWRGADDPETKKFASLSVGRDLPERYGPWQTCFDRFNRWRRDGKGRPLSVVLTAGHRHGSTQLEGVLDAVRVPRSQGSPGRTRKRPAHLLADRGYSFERCRRLLRRWGISHTIPEREDQKKRRAGRPGRRPGFDREAYRRRNVVERCVNKLKQWRGIANRYEKRAVNYLAMVVIASLTSLR